MRIIQNITDRLDLAITDTGQVALVAGGQDRPGGRVVAEVPDIDALIRGLRTADMIAMEQTTTRRASQ